MASDIDGDPLYYSAESDSDAYLSVNGNELTVSPVLDFYGNIELSITVTDTELSDSQNFTLSVNAVNDAPVLSFISDQNINEDETKIKLEHIQNEIADICSDKNKSITNIKSWVILCLIFLRWKNNNNSRWHISIVTYNIFAHFTYYLVPFDSNKIYKLYILQLYEIVICKIFK